MAPMGKMRKILGIVKDHTSIGLAKVASSRAPELDVALVKATSHNDVPADEKYVQQIIQLTSYSRGYARACVEGLGNRLFKTRDWIVAIKALMLIHRLLRDGDPSFEEELLLNRRILQLSGFRDDSHSSAWDFSAFVRTYSLYLSESADTSAPSSVKGTPVSQRDNPRSSFSEYRSEYNSYKSGYEYKSDYDSYRSGYGNSRYEDEKTKRDSVKQKLPNEKISFKDMASDELLEKLSFMQLILERVLACRPTGAAKYHRLVMIALCSMVRESFQLYADLCCGITALLDGFYDMQQHTDRVKAFDIYARSAKQFDDLSSFYKNAKSMGICRPSEYPSVQRVSSEHLATLEEYLKNKSRSEVRSQRPKSPESVSEAKKEPETEMNKEVPEEASNTVLALPAPPTELCDTINDEKHQNTADFITFDEPTSVMELENKLALALFSSTESTGNDNMNFSSKQDTGASQGSQNTSWLNSSEYGKPGWELALVSEATNMKKTSDSMAGGFNSLLLDSMYDQAANTQHYGATAAFPAGSASSVAVAGIMPRPAPAAMQDPFAASVIIAPPSYVQVNDLRQKQHFLLQEQQLWQQYQRNGMQGTFGGMQAYHNPYPYAAGGAIASQHSLAVPYYGINNFAANYYTSY